MEQPARPLEVSPARAFIDLADMPRGMPARQRLILTVLMRRESCDYAELEYSTGMSRRSLSSHCKQLEADGYITREYGVDERGRVPCQIRLGDLTPRQPRPAPPPGCDIGNCRPPAAAAFRAFHSSGAVYRICADCGDGLMIPTGQAP